MEFVLYVMWTADPAVAATAVGGIDGGFRCSDPSRAVWVNEHDPGMVVMCLDVQAESHEAAIEDGWRLSAAAERAAGVPLRLTAMEAMDPDAVVRWEAADGPPEPGD